MANKKKQHYVPQFYLKSFSDKENKFFVYNVENKKAIGHVPYKSQCQESYFYGEDGIWEEELSKRENKWARAFSDLKKGTSIDDKTTKLIKEFIIYQRQRTVGEFEFSKKAREEIVIERGKSIFANNNLEFDAMAEDICKERARNSVSPAELLQMTDTLVETIDDLNILVVEYETKTKLISSDVPVIAINPFQLQTIGYGVMGLILIAPISSNKLVVVYDDKMYPRFKGKQYVVSRNEKEVHNLNVLQLISAEEIVFGEILLTEQYFSPAEWDSRKNNRNKNATTVLGSPNEKIISVGLRSSIYKCELSFGKVSYSFNKIPYPCREAVPRIWDAEVQEKLESKGRIMRLFGSDSNEKKILKMREKDIAEGCRLMLAAAMMYWRK